MKNKKTYKKWLALFLSVVMLTVSGVAMNTGLLAAEDKNAGEPASYTTQESASGNDSGEAENNTTAYTPKGDQLTIDSVLGDAKYFGIVANEWHQAEAETNAAVKRLVTNNSQSGNDLTSGDDEQPWFIGSVSLDKNVTWASTPNFLIKGRPADVYTPEDNFKYIRSNEKTNFHATSENDVNNFVDGLINKIKSNSADYAEKSSGTLPEINQPSDYQLDISDCGSGTFFFDLTDKVNQLQNGGLKIKMNSDQTIVFNIDGSACENNTVNIQKFICTIDGKTHDSGETNAGGEVVAKHVVWNVAGKSTVNMAGSILGMLIAPDATVNIYNTSAGWVCADNVISGSGEWYNIWQSYDQNYPKISSEVQAKKTLAGSSLTEGEFSFELLDHDGNVLQTVKNKADGSVDFADISYTAKGTYEYSIREVIPRDAVNEAGETYAEAFDKSGPFIKDNISYDSAIHKVHVTVSDAYDMTASYPLYKATVTYDDGNTSETPVFNNSVVSQNSTSIKITAEKSLEGGTLNDGEFSFKLTAKDNAPMPAGSENGSKTVKNDADGNINFGDIEYDKAGTYIYTVQENMPEGASADNNYTVNGIKYDNSVKTVAVNVTKADDGTLTAAATDENGNQTDLSSFLKFTNSYKATKRAEAHITAEKALTGGTLKDGEFSFKLTAKDNAPMPEGAEDDSIIVKNGENGAVDFGKIEYSEAGTYKYTVQENMPEGASADNNYTVNGIKYDPAVYTATVTVSPDADGSLKAAVEYSNGNEKLDNLVMTNHEASGSVTFSATKALTGRDMNAKDVFSFAVYEVNENGERTGITPVSIGINKDENGNVSSNINFSQIKYDTPGIHHYEISEVIPADAVHKTDADNNSYYEKNGIRYSSQIYKVKVVVSDENNDGNLKAAVTDENGNPVSLDFVNNYEASNTTASITAKKTLEGRALKDGEFSFKLTAKDNAPMPEGAENGSKTVANNDKGAIDFGEITYNTPGTYEYTISEIKGDVSGVTYDSNIKNVTVTVADKGDGTMTANVAGAGDAATFTNMYKAAAAKADITAKKVLEGRALKNGEFSFTLTAKDNAPMPQGAKDGSITVKNNGEAVNFGTISYDKAGTYNYTVSEVNEKENGVTYDESTKDITVIVEKNDEGNLTASVKGDGDDATFTNTYHATTIEKPTSIRIAGTKTLNGAAGNFTAGQFRFNLYEDGHLIDTAVNDSAGNYVFSNIKYTEKGTHEYTIREQHAGETIDGITYSNETKTVKATVDADSSGNLQIKDVTGGTYTENGSVCSVDVSAFNNTQSQYGRVTVKKSWNDSGNSGFRPSTIIVDLIDAATGKTVQRAELSQDNGLSADFGQLDPGREYTVHEESSGSYYYAQNNDQTVTADVNGKTVTLVNTFTHPSVTIYANKVLNGGTLTNGEFTFNLYRNSNPGTVAQTAVNNASGEILFTNIAYDPAGYTVREAAGTDKRISYDTAAVTYDADGNITSADHTEFTNTERPIVMRVQKRSKEAPYDPLAGSTYGLYQVVPGGNDILVDSQASDENGYMYFDNIDTDTLYYFKEIAASEGHEVDPYAGQKFQLKYTENGQTAIFDENGNPTEVGNITSQDSSRLLVNHTSSKTALNNNASLTYSDDRITAQAEAVEGAFDAGTTMKVTQLSGSSEKSANKAVEAALGKVRNAVAYYNVEFFDRNGNAVEPKAGDVTVTIQYKESLDMPDGTNANELKIVHLKDNNGTTDVQAVAGTIASSSDKLLQTSFSSDTFSTFGIVEPADSSAFNNNFLVTAAGVADQVSQLKIAKLDTAGKYIKGAKLQIIEKSTGTVKAEWNTSDGPMAFARWFDEAKTVPMNVDTDYILHEVSAPDGYALADDIQFRINKYDSSISVYKYDDSGNLVLDQEAVDKWVSSTTLQMIDTPVEYKTNKIVKQRIIPNERTIQGGDNVVHAASVQNVRTGDSSPTALLVIIFAASVGSLIILLVRKRRTRNRQ